MREFITKTTDGIKKNPSQERYIHDKDLLMSVMKIISDVKDVDPSIGGIVSRIKEMVTILKKN